jgi:hypothetical protein
VKLRVYQTQWRTRAFLVGTIIDSVYGNMTELNPIDNEFIIGSAAAPMVTGESAGVSVLHAS